MKIERINENQIRCTLTSFDLSMRNLNLSELAYGSEKARSLFREMIQKASNEVGFEADDIPLMVEAIPLSNESVMLVITKIEDPEELDTRFAKFAPQSDEEGDGAFSYLANELLEGADSMSDLLIEQTPGKTIKDFLEASAAISGDKTEDAVKPSNAISARVYIFTSLDRVCEAAAVVGQVCQVENTLYKKPDTSKYFLVLKNSSQEAIDFSRICNILSEYGSKIKHDYATEAYYEEHYEVIVKNKALQALSNL